MFRHVVKMKGLGYMYNHVTHEKNNCLIILRLPQPQKIMLYNHITQLDNSIIAFKVTHNIVNPSLLYICINHKDMCLLNATVQYISSYVIKQHRIKEEELVASIKRT